MFFTSEELYSELLKMAQYFCDPEPQRKGRANFLVNWGSEQNIDKNILINPLVPKV